MDVMSVMESMGTGDIAILAAFFIGLMMAISPCPLAQNITAIAYVSKRIDNSHHTIAVGILYTLGRMVTYVAIASLIVFFGLNVQAIALPLEAYADKLLGPLLIVIGIFMLDLVRFSLPGTGERFQALRKQLAERGYIGSFVLGMVFALTFCPFSAVLFFGMLIPLALAAGDGIVIPAVFAFATGLPVIVFSFLLVYGISHVTTAMNKVSVAEHWIRKIVGVVFVVVGIYYTVISLFPGI